ncbi:MAG: hypothetical protein PF481_00785 [Bacteroidales bacterium]|nr:hypothetical protein [Bacteroidales bacterium]
MKYIFFIAFLFISWHGEAQYMSYGTDKGSTQWKQIQTEHFQVIYPENYDSIAQIFSNKLEYIYEYASKSLGHQPAKISVLLHNQSDISNGFVAWAPKRMEIFNTISQNQLAQDWFELLAIHEYRHVVQTDMINRGLTNMLYFLLGEQAVGAVLGIYVPLWFLEGDAVVTETALSNSGRGRQAEFSMGLRTHLNQDILYSYDKAYFGSYKDFVPNHYAMGYYFVSGVRRNYSQNVWNNALKRVGDKPFSFTPFNKAIKLETKLSKTELYEETFTHQQNLWKLDFDREGKNPFDTLTQKKKVYTNYMFPQQISPDTIIAQKSGYKDIPFFVHIDQNGHEKKICRVGFKPNKEAFSTNDTYIVWAETNDNIRWELAATRNINIYNIQTEEITRIHTQTQVFSPAISPLNNQIGAVAKSENNMYSLVLFDIASSQQTLAIPIPNNEFPQNPSWNDSGSHIVFTTTSAQGKRILEYNTETAQFSEIHSYTYDDISNPIYWKDYIIYSSSFSGVDNIYAIHRKTKKVFRLTASSYGCKYPSVYKDMLLFSDYSITGFRIGRTQLHEESWDPIEVIKKERYDIARNLQARENGPVDFSKRDMKEYEEKKYNKLLRLFNIHSWMPFYLEYNNGGISDNGLGVQVLSQNILSTMIASAGYKQTNNGSKRAGFVNLNYSGFYPIITAEMQRGYESFNQKIDSTDVTADYQLKEGNITIEVPFNFSSRGYYRNISIGASSIYNDYTLESVDPEIYTTYFRNTLQRGTAVYFLQFTNQRMSAYRDIAPRYGQAFIVGYKEPMFKNTHYYSQSLFSELYLYLPGFLYNHSLHIYTGYEYNIEDVYEPNIAFYKNNIQVPRGINNSFSNFKHAYTIKTGYAFPLLYPDISLGPVLYLKRIRLEAFADVSALSKNNDIQWISTMSNNTTHTIMSSSGFSLTGDMHLFRTIPECAIGVQYAHIHQSGNNDFKFLLNFKI